jgi:putative hydrolase of the HAD superfamily
MIIFFDIDETLIDQRRAERAAAERFLDVYGAELGDRSVERFCARWRALREKHGPAFLAGAISVHEQRRRRVRGLFSGRGRPLPDAEIDRRIALYERHYRQSWLLFDDVRPALERLRSYRCGIISNGSSPQQHGKLRRTGIAAYFDPVLVSEDVGAAKPRREIFLAACQRAGVTAERCIYVGDRLDHDALPSRAAGMRPFWLCRRAQQAPAGIETIASLSELAPRLARRSAA